MAASPPPTDILLAESMQPPVLLLELPVPSVQLPALPQSQRAGEGSHGAHMAVELPCTLCWHLHLLLTNATMKGVPGARPEVPMRSIFLTELLCLEAQLTFVMYGCNQILKICH